VKLGNRQLVEKLTRSAIYRDYLRAFSAATGMPLALRAVICLCDLFSSRSTFHIFLPGD
jgi:hypothetical protein